MSESNSEEKRLNTMKWAILKLEKENLKTQVKNKEQMVERIRQIITDESKKRY